MDGLSVCQKQTTYLDHHVIYEAAVFKAADGVSNSVW